MNQVLLSIIIPTRNRQAECLATVRAALNFADPFELIVCDSSANLDLQSEINRLCDDRVRYIHQDVSRNMIESFEFAIVQARGTYVCMIGDDDGITPHLFAWADRALKGDYSSVTTVDTAFAFYNWPGIRSRYFGDAASGKLYLHVPSALPVAPADMPSLVAKLLDNAGQGCGALPRVYHGLVRKDVLQEMKLTYGRHFAGVSPDVSFSYLASQFSLRHLIVAEPLTISGQSVRSNAGRSAMGRHKGDLWSDPHMQHFQNENWPGTVPEFFSVQTVWAQATLAAREIGGIQRNAPFNYARLYALLLLHHPDQWRLTLRCLTDKRAHQPHKPPGLRQVLGEFVHETALSAGRTFTKLYRKIRPDPNIAVMTFPTISAATLYIQRLNAT